MIACRTVVRSCIGALGEFILIVCAVLVSRYLVSHQPPINLMDYSVFILALLVIAVILKTYDDKISLKVFEELFYKKQS